MFKLKRLQFILVVILLQLTLSVNAQVYPVQGNVVLNPPYSPYLADLTALGSQRFWLSLRLQDPTLSTYNCKLRLTIEGVGITIRTKNTFLPPPITLEGGGIPQLFYGDDLAAYFNPANLDFAGLTRSQYERTQRLPEGVYRFTIEALDYNRGTLVSNKIGTTAWIVLNQPPLLNLPQHDRKIPIIEPINIPFTWTPRHTGSPNAAFTTNYVFRLIELAPNATGQAANAAFLSQPVLFETTLSQNQFVYGPAEPSLLAGRKYAWQVQAIDTEGRDLFRNNGKSEVFVFQYGDALGIPRNVLQQGGNATTLSIAWDLPSQGEMPTQYRIRYKPYTSPANNWFESVTTGRYYTIGGLNPSTNYIVQVRSERGSIFSEYSAPLQMSTISLEERGYTCGAEPVLKPPTSTEILPRLFPGDEIKMHDFSVMVMTVEGRNGNYSGTGLMRVSLFNNASVKVRFSGRVNIHYELAGEIVSIPRKNSAMGQLVDEMEKIGADRKRAQDSVANATNPTPIPISIIGIIDSVWVQDSVIVVQREDGTQEEIVRPQAQDGTMQEVVLTDSVGNSYTVQQDPTTGETTVTQTGAGGQQTGSSATVQTDPIKDRIIVLILEQFEEEITTWLSINGKGGEDDPDLLLAEELQQCFPRNEYILEHINESTIPYFKQHPAELRVRIESNQTNKELFDRIAKPFGTADAAEWNKVPQEDAEMLKNATCLATVEGDLEVLKTEFTSSMGTANVSSSCFGQALERSRLLYGKYDYEVVLYAGFIKYLVCETEKENCGSGELSSFSCGITNGLLQELDWVVLLEGEGITEEDIVKLILCVKDEYPIGGRVEDNPDFYKILFKCITGVELGDLSDAIGDFISENWNEPYYQGQATAFVVTLISPFKAKIIAKIKTLPTYSSKYASKIAKLEALAKANNADELVGIAKSLSKGAKTNILNKLTGLDDAKAFVNSLDDVADAGLLNRINNLSQTQLDNLNAFYKNRQSPAGFSTTDYNFTATKTINGQQVSINYKNGFPEFHNTPHCPTMNYPNGTSGKFKFQSNSLKGVQPDFDLANESLLNKFGIQKGSPKNTQGFYQSGNYRWDGDTQWFELQNQSGVWEKYTWHHFQDGSTMIPVSSKIHNANLGGFTHSGGNSILNGAYGGIKGIFEFTGY